MTLVCKLNTQASERSRNVLHYRIRHLFSMAVYRTACAGARRVSLKKRFQALTRKSRWGAISTQGVSVPCNMFGFPGSLTSVFKYSDTIGLSSGSGVTPGGLVWRMNSVFDPDYSNIGHQLLYFDQFTAVYDNYVVLGAKLTAIFSPASDGAAPFNVGITSGNSTSFSSSVYTLIEQNKSVAGLLGDKDGTSVKTLSMTYNPSVCLGVSANDDTVQAGVTGNPAKQWFCYTWVQDRSGNSSTVQVNVTIEYRVRFFGMKNITSS